jgi:DNA polymerase-3 subunit epsilon
MLTSSLIVLDFETTGMSPDQGDRVTEVAALRVEQGVIVDEFVSLINCDVFISPFISQLTGITQSMIARAPSVEEVFPQLLRFIGDRSVLAHNASFDEKFLKAEAAQLGLKNQHEHMICSVKLTRRLFPQLPSYALGNLAKQLNLQFQGKAHRAKADAQVTVQLLNRCVQQLQTQHGAQQFDAHLLHQINQQTAAKVPAFLKKSLCPAM